MLYITGELLLCQVEFGNIHDPYPATVASRNTTVALVLVDLLCLLEVKKAPT